MATQNKQLDVEDKGWVVAILASILFLSVFLATMVLVFLVRWEFYDGIVVGPDTPITPGYESFWILFWQHFYGPVGVFTFAVIAALVGLLSRECRRLRQCGEAVNSIGQ